MTIFGGSPNFGAGVFAWKTYTGLPAHYQATVSVKLFFIDSWDEESLSLIADGNTVYQESYTVIESPYPDTCGNSDPDKIITITSSPFSHNTSNLTLNFTTTLDEAGTEESFGFNNIYITIDLCDSACSACTGPSNTECTSCNQGWFLNETTCNTTCPTGYYSNAVTNGCNSKFFFYNVA